MLFCIVYCPSKDFAKAYDFFSIDSKYFSIVLALAFISLLASDDN